MVFIDSDDLTIELKVGFSIRLAMNQGKYIFAQLFEKIYWYDFDLFVKWYDGDCGVKSFTCWEQFLVISFAQFSYRESLRDIEYCLESIS